MILYADREDPSWLIEWRDHENALIDFSSGWEFRVEFLSTRQERVLYTKTGGITGASTSPNVTVAWAVGELANRAGRVKLRLVAKDLANDRERVFREGSLPVVRIIPAPVS